MPLTRYQLDKDALYSNTLIARCFANDNALGIRMNNLCEFMYIAVTLQFRFSLCRIRFSSLFYMNF